MQLALEWNATSGNLSGCISGTWTVIGSSTTSGCATLGGDLSGSCAAATVAKVNGGSIPALSQVLGSNSSNQIITAPLTSAQIWVGNVSNIPNAQAISGDATLSNAGLLTNTGVNGAVVPTTATLTSTNSSKQLIAASLTSGGIYVGNGSNLPVAVAPSQDVTMTNTGAFTVGGINTVPLCTGFTPTNGQNLQYTTASSPNPCWTAVVGSGGTTIWTGSTSPNGGSLFSPTNMTSDSAPSPFVASGSSRDGSGGEMIIFKVLLQQQIPGG